MHSRALRTAVAGPGTGILLVLGLAACGTPAEYRHPGEIPEGPGMFTGEQGAVEFSTDDTAEKAASSRQSTDCACPDADELEAYREFLRWKAEAIGTEEYREFQQWRQWRRQRSDIE